MQKIRRQKPQKIKKSLVYSFWDGFFASIQFGIVEQFATPLALFMGGGSAAVGFLNFVKGALVSIIQVFSADLTRCLRSRKKLITGSVFLAALLWLPAFFLPFCCAQYKVLIFIIFFTLAASLNMLPNPAWASLMSQYIPAGKRGQYFGFRGMVLGIVYCLSVVLAGWVLYILNPISLFWGFAILILVASGSRLVSWIFLTKYFEPRLKVKSADYFSFIDFVRRWPAGNFVRFTVFSSILMFGVTLVSPFFAVYLLEDLKFDYFSFTIIVAAAVLTIFVTQQYWGKLADKYGNMKIIKLSAVLVSMVPVFWLFSHNFWYLLAVQLCSGFVWAGYNLTSVNFIYDAAIPAKRERCLAYFNFFSGFGQGAGALLGGFGYQALPGFLGSAFFLLLIISGAVRLAAAIGINYFNHEVKAVSPVKMRTLISDLFGFL